MWNNKVRSQLLPIMFVCFVGFTVAPTVFQSYGDVQLLLVEEDPRCLSGNYFITKGHLGRTTDLPQASWSFSWKALKPSKAFEHFKFCFIFMDFFCFCWVYRRTNSISVIWRRPAITGGGRPRVPLRALFHHEGHLGRTTDLPQASWMASSHIEFYALNRVRTHTLKLTQKPTSSNVSKTHLRKFFRLTPTLRK